MNEFNGDLNTTFIALTKLSCIVRIVTWSKLIQNLISAKLYHAFIQY